MAKKKISRESLQKIERAQQRNEFMRRLHQFCDQVAGPGVFNLIPQSELENIYRLRILPIRIREASGQCVHPETMKEFRKMAPLMFKSWMLPFEIGNLHTISAYDFFTIALTLILHADRIKETSYANSFSVKHKLAHLAAFAHTPEFEHCINQYAHLGTVLSMIYSDLGVESYAFKTVLKSEMNGAVGMNFYLEVYALKTENKPVTIEGNARPVFRVGSPVGGDVPHLEFVKIPSATLDKLPGLFLDVYIQEHALQRLLERMHGVPIGLLHHSLYHSLRNPKVCRNRDGAILFEFHLSGKKTGYLVALIVDGCIVIRTFLFLTNAGTPEGDLLRANRGLKTKDVIYLNIDKLSTFIESDIAQDPAVKQIFLEAGCKSLFEIDKDLYYWQNMKELHVAGFIAGYLGLKGAA